MKIALLILILLVLVFSVASDTEVITRNGGSVKIENSNYLIDWELEVSGYSPHSGKFIIEGSRIMSKDQDRTVDLAIISPVAFDTGSKATVAYDTTEAMTIPRSYTCDSPKYGWNNPEYTEAYCNHTITSVNNETGQPETYDVKEIILLPSEATIQRNENSATLSWEDTQTLPKTVVNDMTSNFHYLNQNTPYGNNIYYVKDATFKAGREYKFTFELNLDKSELPVKYAVCFGDMDTQTLYFCLDPQFTDAKTWTTSSDFGDNTLNNRLSLDNDQLSLLNKTAGVISYWKEEDYTDSLNWAGEGSPTNSPTIVAARISNGIHTDADSTQWVSVPYTDFHRLVYDNSSTINVWFYDDSQWNAKHDGMLNIVSTAPHESSECARNGWALGVFNSSNSAGSNPGAYLGMQLNCYNGNTYVSGCSYIIHGPFVNTSTWYMVTITHNITTNDWKLYLNGDFYTNYTGDPNIVDGGTFCKMAINGRPDSTWPDWTWGGTTDELSFSNYEWSAEEISSVYNAGAGKTYPLNYYETNGSLTDRHGWNPQAGHSIRNISFSTYQSISGAIYFRYNITNSSLDSSAWTSISTNGTHVVNLSLDAGNAIYYEIMLNDAGSQTPRIFDYTMYESLLNTPPTAPTDIGCNGGLCNTSFNDILILNCSGSVDDNGDEITYMLELGNNTESGTVWTPIGNHTEDSTLSWNIPNETSGETYEYIRCRAIDANGSNTYSGYYLANVSMTVYHLATEEEGMTAIEEGINTQLASATIYENVIIYVVDGEGNHTVRTYDRFTTDGSTDWAFNYVTGSEPYLLVSPINSVVYLWDHQQMTVPAIRQSVEDLISSTK